MSEPVSMQEYIEAAQPILENLLRLLEFDDARLETSVVEDQIFFQIVTADALHTQRPTARLIVERGGEYLLQVKANQPHLLQTAQQSIGSSSPFLPSRKNTTAASNDANCF